MCYLNFCKPILILLIFLSIENLSRAQVIDSALYEAFNFEIQLADSYNEGYDTIAVNKVLTGQYVFNQVDIDSVFGKNKSDDTEIVYLGDFSTSNGARYKLVWYLKFDDLEHEFGHIRYDRILAFDNSNELIGYYDFRLRINSYPFVYTERRLINGVLTMAPNRGFADCYMPEPAVTILIDQFPINLNTKFCEQQYDRDRIESGENPMPVYFIPVK